MVSVLSDTSCARVGLFLALAGNLLPLWYIFGNNLRVTVKPIIRIFHKNLGLR